jgi:mRNA interferase RelE/StbE
MSWTLTWEPRAVAAASRFLKDDSEGLAQVLAATDYLLTDPRPSGSTAYGSPDLRRIRVGWYRLVYEVDDTASTVNIIHIGRVE